MKQRLTLRRTKTVSPQQPRRGVLTVELLLTLPILLIVLLAIVEFSIVFLSDQALTAAASIGARAATLPGATHASVNDAVHQAIDDWAFAAHLDDVQIEINGDPDSVTPLTTAVTGDAIEVRLSVDTTDAAPNLLQFVGISLTGQKLTASFVMRKE